MTKTKKIIMAAAVGFAAVAITMWVGLRTLNITYHLDGGDAFGLENQVHFLNLVSLGEPTKNAYDFDGWYLDSDYTVSLTDGYRITGDTDIYAKWEKHKYQVRLHNIGEQTDNGANRVSTASTLKTFSYSIGEGVELPTMIRKGQDFIGWSSISNVSDANNDETTVDTSDDETILDSSGLYIDADKDAAASAVSTAVKGISLTTSKDLDLYPVFKNHVYNLSYELNGGSCGNLPGSYTYGSTIDLPTPTRDSYTFCGWYFDSDCTEAASITSKTTGDKTLYAAWKYNPPVVQQSTTNYSTSSMSGNTASASSGGGSYIKLYITNWFYMTYDMWTATESRVGVYFGTADPYDNRPAYLCAHLGQYYGNVMSALNTGDLISFNGATYRVSYRQYTNAYSEDYITNAMNDADYGSGNHIWMQTCADYAHVGNDWLIRAELVG